MEPAADLYASSMGSHSCPHTSSRRIIRAAKGNTLPALTCVKDSLPYSLLRSACGVADGQVEGVYRDHRVWQHRGEAR